MELGSNEVLITGGGSGIGFALADRLVRAGSRVIICGRREEKLREARQKRPELQIRVCDVATESDRVSLLEWANGEFPRWNVLVNNAGIQRRVALESAGDWTSLRQEIVINLEAPMHLSMLAIPHLLKQKNPAILNVTSGLAFVPLAGVPIYSATKAAMHSFTLSLRKQLAETPIRVIEIVPPAVDTDLGGPGLHTFGANVDEFVDAILPRIQAGDLEIAYGFAQQASRASRDELDAIFQRMNTAGS